MKRKGGLEFGDYHVIWLCSHLLHKHLKLRISFFYWIQFRMWNNFLLTLIYYFVFLYQDIKLFFITSCLQIFCHCLWILCKLFSVKKIEWSLYLYLFSQSWFLFKMFKLNTLFNYWHYFYKFNQTCSVKLIYKTVAPPNVKLVFGKAQTWHVVFGPHMALVVKPCFCIFCKLGSFWAFGLLV